MDDNERKGVGMKTTTKTEIKPNVQLVVVVLISFSKLVVAIKNIIHFYE